MLVADVGEAKDAAQIQTNIVRVDGQRSVYLPVLKQGGSNTIAVVNGIKNAVANLLDVPTQLVTKVVFDQSVFVKNAIKNLVLDRWHRLGADGTVDLRVLRQHARHRWPCSSRFRCRCWPRSSRCRLATTRLTR